MATRFYKVFQWLLIILIVWVVYQIARRLLGGSLGYNEVLTALLVINITFSFHLSRQFSGHIGWHKGRGDRRNAESQFLRIN